MLILSIDPGVTTGLCLGRLSQDRVYVRAYQDELSHLGLYRHINETAPSHIVCENFSYRPGQAKPSLVLASLEMIGVVKLYAEQNTHVMLYMQEAHEAEGKNAYFNNDRLKQMGLYQRGVPHGLSAMRHLLAWFNFKQGYQYNSSQTILLAR